eukprot:symbB.v1.2.011855.t1/scaffold801.1/size161289/11
MAKDHASHLFLTLDRMRRHHQWNQDTTARHFTLALAACANSKAWQGATWLLATMPLAEVTPNIFSCNAAISSCEKAHAWHAALHCFVVTKETLQPDAISFNASISFAMATSTQLVSFPV